MISVWLIVLIAIVFGLFILFGIVWFLPVFHQRHQIHPRTQEIEAKFQHSLISAGLHLAMPLSSNDQPNKQQELLLFIHDLPGCWFSFNKSLNYFKDNQKLFPIAMDIRGWNLSVNQFDGNTDWFEVGVKDIAFVVSRLGYRKVHIVGIGIGALLAWEFANSNQKQIASLTTISSPHPAAFHKLTAFSMKLIFFSFFHHLPYLTMSAISNNNFAQMEDIYFGSEGLVDKNALAKEDVELFKDALARGDALHFWSWFSRSAFYFYFNRKEYSKLNIPILQIRGDRDTMVSLKMLEETQSFIQDKSLFRNVTIPNCSRRVALDRPDEFNSILSNFISEIAAKSR